MKLDDLNKAMKATNVGSTSWIPIGGAELKPESLDASLYRISWRKRDILHWTGKTKTWQSKQVIKRYKNRKYAAINSL